MMLPFSRRPSEFSLRKPISRFNENRRPDGTKDAEGTESAHTSHETRREENDLFTHVSPVADLKPIITELHSML
jgi:hypothetical protein